VTDEIAVKQSTFSLEVKKWAFEEQLNNFVNQWVTPLSAIYTAISAIISGILGWIYGTKQKKGDKKNKDHNRNKGEP
jgi:ABC-type transporter Mla maintaining outer membrane lipid asymmetry permease subunit MlaE